jgi:hypothetical protein
MFQFIKINTLSSETQNSAQVHPVSIDHPWDVSTIWLESTCGKFKCMDMIGKGSHLSIYGPTMRLKKFSVEPQPGLWWETDLGKSTKQFSTLCWLGSPIVPSNSCPKLGADLLRAQVVHWSKEPHLSARDITTVPGSSPSWIIYCLLK